MKLITILFTAFTLFNCKEKTTDRKLSCTDFKTGTFELVNKTTNRKYLIERTKDLQIEQTYDLAMNKKIKKDRYYKITWKNDCEYNLQLDTVKSEPDEFDIFVNSNGGYNCSIKQINGNCAITESRLEGEAYSSEICKIR